MYLYRISTQGERRIDLRKKALVASEKKFNLILDFGCSLQYLEASYVGLYFNYSNFLKVASLLCKIC